MDRAFREARDLGLGEEPGGAAHDVAERCAEPLDVLGVTEPVDDQAHAEPVAGLIDEKLAELRRIGVWVSAPAGNHHHTTGISWPACQPSIRALFGSVSICSRRAG